MDIMRRSTKVLLVLIQVTCLAISDTHFWLGAGYDFSIQSFSIDTKILPDEIDAQLISIDRLPITLDESGFFFTIEAETDFSPDVSGSVRFMFLNPEKSAFKPLVVHTTNTFGELYGKYHFNQLSYLLGYSLQHDNIKISDLSNTNNTNEHSRVISSVAAGAETYVTQNTKLSLTTMMTIPFFDESAKPTILPLSKYNVRVAMSYNLDNLK